MFNFRLFLFAFLLTFANPLSLPSACHTSHAIDENAPLFLDSSSKIPPSMLSAWIGDEKSIRRFSSSFSGSPSSSKKFASCALVGNSGTLLGMRAGSEIDEHDLVIRFNLRSQLPAFTGESRGAVFTWAEHFRELKHASHDYNMALATLNAANARKIARTRRKLNGTLPLNLLSLPLHVFTRQLLCVGSGRRNIAPSSGFSAVVFALVACRSVRLFGFEVANGLPHHYDGLRAYERKELLSSSTLSRQQLNSSHSLQIEHELYAQWEKTANLSIARLSDRQANTKFINFTSIELASGEEMIIDCSLQQHVIIGNLILAKNATLRLILNDDSPSLIVSQLTRLEGKLSLQDQGGDQNSEFLRAGIIIINDDSFQLLVNDEQRAWRVSKGGRKRKSKTAAEILSINLSSF